MLQQQQQQQQQAAAQAQAVQQQAQAVHQQAQAVTQQMQSVVQQAQVQQQQQQQSQESLSQPQAIAQQQQDTNTNNAAILQSLLANNANNSTAATLTQQQQQLAILQYQIMAAANASNGGAAQTSSVTVNHNTQVVNPMMGNFGVVNGGGGVCAGLNIQQLQLIQALQVRQQQQQQQLEQQQGQMVQGAVQGQMMQQVTAPTPARPSSINPQPVAAKASTTASKAKSSTTTKAKGTVTARNKKSPPEKPPQAQGGAIGSMKSMSKTIAAMNVSMAEQHQRTAVNNAATNNVTTAIASSAATGGNINNSMKSMNHIMVNASMPSNVGQSTHWVRDPVTGNLLPVKQGVNDGEASSGASGTVVNDGKGKMQQQSQQQIAHPPPQQQTLPKYNVPLAGSSMAPIAVYGIGAGGTAYSDQSRPTSNAPATARKTVAAASSALNIVSSDTDADNTTAAARQQRYGASMPFSSDDNYMSNALSGESATEDNNNLTDEDKIKSSRERNREHAKNTRLRKKAYVERLKITVDNLCRERDTLVSERATAANLMVEIHSKRVDVLRSFFALRASYAPDQKRELWSSILDESCFTCRLPVTPYQSFPSSEVQLSNCQRTIVGVDAMIADVASNTVFLESVVDRSQYPHSKIKFQYTLVTEESVVAGNQVMARWAMETLNAKKCGARTELHQRGMLFCKFNSAHKIVSLEIMFDVMAFMLQVKVRLWSSMVVFVPCRLLVQSTHPIRSPLLYNNF
jgi:hypothetical protein